MGGVSVLGQDEQGIRQAGSGCRTIVSTTGVWSCELGAEALSLPTSGEFLLQANGTARQNQQAPTQ